MAITRQQLVQAQREADARRAQIPGKRAWGEDGPEEAVREDKGLRGSPYDGEMAGRGRVAPSHERFSTPPPISA